MHKRTIIFYWALLFVPTVIIGVFAFQMLGREAARIEAAVRDSARDRARAVADTIQLTVLAVKEELVKSLMDISPARLHPTLLQWEENNPLVRHGFIWSPDTGLGYPVVDQKSRSEERRFAIRYEALFSGRIPWTQEKPDDGQAPIVAPSLVQDIRQLKAGRGLLYDSARTANGAALRIQNSGWMPWFFENRLHLLGWVRRADMVYGIELEMLSLLSRLVGSFPKSVPQGVTLALVDDAGRILHQAGALLLKPDARFDLALPLAPELPHWRVAVVLAPAGEPTRPGFMLLAGLLLAIFLLAIIAGGSLLTWQAHQNRKEAL